MSERSYDYADAPPGAMCLCGHAKEQHAHPGAAGTPCGAHPCWCSAFRRWKPQGGEHRG